MLVFVRLLSQPLEVPYNELATSVHHSEVVNIDETSWRENRQKAWLWATVTGLYTVFTIAKSRSGEIAAALLGSEDDQVVGSDRFSAYEWIKASCRQVCWAHLRRDFQEEGHALQPRDDFGMSHGRTGNGGHRIWWKSEGRNSIG